MANLASERGQPLPGSPKIERKESVSTPTSPRQSIAGSRQVPMAAAKSNELSKLQGLFGYNG